MGISMTLKTALRPQITPFLVKEEIKMESGNAYG